MDGFKDSTRMRFMKGGSCEAYAKGGKVKGAAKVAKVMGEFKRGELHSGSKKGPKVTNPKQAKAIALSEAREAGAKIPIKKAEGGTMKPGETLRRAERVQREEQESERKLLKKGMSEKQRRMTEDALRRSERMQGEEQASESMLLSPRVRRRAGVPATSREPMIAPRAKGGLAMALKK